MLNFTYSSKDASGQFNGRFVFRAPLLASALTRDHLRAIANSTGDALADPALRHEFLHWKVFQHSEVGRSLIGKRYRVRPLFLKGFDGSVRRYYTQRSAYFLSGYDAHEATVDELDKSTGSSIEELRAAKLTTHQLDRIRLADQRALEMCAQLHVPLGGLQLKLDSYLGRLATKEFGVQAYLPTDDGNPHTRLYEVSLKGDSFGIFNAGTETEFSVSPPTHIRIVRRMISLANSERWFGALDSDKLARWTFLKFSTELPLLKSERNTSSIGPDAYVETMVAFITRYLGRPRRVSEQQIVELLKGCAMYSQDEVTERLRLLDEDFLYFFYAHGN